MGIASSNDKNPEYTSLEIYRPVTGDDDFLARANHLALKVFGFEQTAVVAEFIEHDDDIDAFESQIKTKELRNIGFPRATVKKSDELELVLLERKVPRELNYASSFRNAAGKLIRMAEKVTSTTTKNGVATEKYRTSPLYESLDSIGIRFDILDQEEVPIEIDGIHTDVEATKSNNLPLYLSLNPAKKSTRMLLEQSQFCMRSLAAHNKRAAYPASRTPLDIHFIDIPKDASERQINTFVHDVRSLLPRKLIMRGVMSRITQ